MIILGMDPGTAITGYGVVELTGNKFTALAYGVIRTESKLALAARLDKIYSRTVEIINEYGPHQLAIEELFFNKNAKTALSVGHARGVLMLAAARHGLEVYQYTPLQVKQAVVGYGKAEKEQVQYMVKSILNLAQLPKPDDLADALAVAICHGNSYNFCRQVARLEDKK